MIKQLVPWVTSAFTLWAMWLLATKRWEGWVVGLLNQICWVSTAVLYKTWGLLPLTAALIVVYTKGLIAWRRESLALPL